MTNGLLGCERLSVVSLEGTGACSALVVDADEGVNADVGVDADEGVNIDDSANVCAEADTVIGC
eukprot:6203598-Pleurochrysis_carterae.AAC.5